MIAVEIETEIVDHRVNVRSELLPAAAGRARVIVMYEQSDTAGADVLARARAAQASFPRQPEATLTADLDALRAQWSRQP